MQFNQKSTRVILGALTVSLGLFLVFCVSTSFGLPSRKIGTRIHVQRNKANGRRLPTHVRSAPKKRHHAVPHVHDANERGGAERQAAQQ